MTRSKRQRTTTLIECAWCQDSFLENELEQHIRIDCLDASLAFTQETEEYEAEEETTYDVFDFQDDYPTVATGPPGSTPAPIQRSLSPMSPSPVELDPTAIVEPDVYKFASTRQPLTEMQQFGLRFQSLVNRHQLTQVVQRELGTLFNDLVNHLAPGKLQYKVKAWHGVLLITDILIYSDTSHAGSDPFPSTYMSTKTLINTYPIDAKSYSVCVKGCMLFNNNTLTQCLICKAPRYKDETYNIPRRLILTVSLADQLALLIFNKATRERLLYRSQYQQTTKMDDIFAGSNYRSVAHQLFPNELDIALSLYTDGFNSSSSKAGKMTMVHVVINNYHPAIRFKNENMIQLLVIPGPDSAKGEGFWSFMKPVLDDLRMLATTGISVECDNGQVIQSKAHMLMAIGDLPAVSSMAGHSGHNSYNGCHICPIRGQVGPSRHGMYFPPSNYDAALPWRSSAEFDCNPEDLLPCPNVA
ncbi:hypothetical protein [Absidia glauca]|uniref:Uncharacterized protein n=1 Tax=Absidia glauca TaxID=4829 RepID=A0A168PPF4_ABSGL|nr:hypothetical protein [Absidia glauca]